MKENISQTDVKFWIQLGTIVVAITAGFVVMREQIKANSARIDQHYEMTKELSVELEAHKEQCIANHKENDKKLLEIQVSLAEIQRDIQYIRTQL